MTSNNTTNSVTQLNLPGMDKSNISSVISDPGFASNKSLPVHRWVPWIAGFSSTFVRNILEHYLPSPGRVLDPFSGVGTTLVESVLLGHDAVGFEINPYPALASALKSQPVKPSTEDLQNQIQRLERFYSERVHADYQPGSTPPDGFRTRSPFYSEAVLRKVLIIQDFVISIQDDVIRDYFRLAFAATMVRYSNYSYEPSLGRRESSGKPNIDDYPVGREIIQKLQIMVDDIGWFNQVIASHQREVSAQVINTTFLNVEEYLEVNTIDLIITSPPYLNNYHYNRNTRPQLYWLGYVDKPSDMKPLEYANLGKYWQTVRDAENIDLCFTLSNPELRQQIEELREIRKDKGVYGGNGWANYAASYFNDSYHALKGMHYALKAQGRAFVVIGNSILQGIHIPTDRHFADIAELVGFKCIDIHVPRETRVGNSIIASAVRVKKAKKNRKLYEAVVELEKI